jgi:hypothetical protein
MSLEYFFDVLMEDVSPYLTEGTVPLVRAASYVLQTGGEPLVANKLTNMHLSDLGYMVPTIPYWPTDWKLEIPGIPNQGVDLVFPGTPTGELKITVNEDALPPLVLDPGWPPPAQVGGYSLWRPDVDEQGPWPEIQRFLFVPECDPVLGCVKGSLYIIVEREGVAYPPMGPVSPFLHHLVPLDELVPWPPPLFGEQGGGIWRMGWVTGGNHVLPSPSHVFRLPVEVLGPKGLVPVTAPGEGVVFEIVYAVNSRVKPAKAGTVTTKYLDFAVRYGVGPSNYLTIIHLHRLTGEIVSAMGAEYPELGSLPPGSSGTVLVNVRLEGGQLLGWFGGRVLQEQTVPADQVPAGTPMIATSVELIGVNYAKSNQLMGLAYYPSDFGYGDTPFPLFLTDLQQELAQHLFYEGAAPLFDAPPVEFWGAHDWDKYGTLRGNWIEKGVDPQQLLSGEHDLSFAPHFQDDYYQMISVGSPAHWMPGSEGKPPVGSFLVTGHAPGLDFAEVYADVHAVNHPDPALDNPVLFEVHPLTMAPLQEPIDDAQAGFVLVGFEYGNLNQVQIQVFRKVLNQLAPTAFVSPPIPGWCSEIGVYVRAGS